MSDDALLVEISNHVAILRLNRPQALNALDRALRLALVRTLGDLDRDETVRVIVLTGVGRAFCAGLDVRELATSQASVTEDIAGGDLGGAIAALRKPIIAAVNGPAVTGGFEIALACDIVLAAQSAYFADTHVQVGLLPGWGLSQRLSRIVGPGTAKEISLTARRVTAGEAAALGFVTRVVPGDDLLAQALELASRIAAASPAAVAAIKALIDDGFGKPFADALEHERTVSRTFNGAVSLGWRSGGPNAEPS